MLGKAANRMIEEVRRQFREIPGLMEGMPGPITQSASDISTSAAIRQMVLPGVLAILTPIIVGFGSKWAWGDSAALGGLLAGVTVTGVLMAIFMANSMAPGITPKNRSRGTPKSRRKYGKEAARGIRLPLQVTRLGDLQGYSRPIAQYFD